LCLGCISLIAVNHEGKEETITNKLIRTSNLYLMNDHIDVVNYAVSVMMFASIHLQGKKQCIMPEDDEIIKRLIELLNHENLDVVTNVRQTLINIADLPKGFNIITKYLSTYIESLENIFGSTSIIPLYSLLECVDEVPFFNSSNFEHLKVFANAISYFINSDKQVNEALQYSIEKTCRITTKLLPFLLCHSDRDFQAFVAKAIEKIAEEDEVNRLAIRLFIEKHGDTEHEMFGTTVNKELAKFGRIMEIVNRAAEEDDEEGGGDMEEKEGESEN